MKNPVFLFNTKSLLIVACFFMMQFQLLAQEENHKPGASPQEIADKLANPVANLISVPLQNNLNYGVDPSVLVMRQGKGLSVGFLVNQIWSVAGNQDRTDFNQFYTQIFISHSYKSGASLGGNAEITQNWKANTTLIKLNPSIGV